MAGSNPFNNSNNKNTLQANRKRKTAEKDPYQGGAEVIKKILLGVLMVVTFYPPFVRGLFFEENQFPAAIIIFAAFALFWIYKWLKRDREFLKTPIEYASLGFVIVYFISLFVSIGLRLAIAEWIKYCMYFALFFMVTDLVGSLKEKMALLWVVIASAVGVCIVGIDGAAGEHIAKIVNGFFPPEYPLFFDTFKDGRIFSSLQYPNALASILMAVFFITLVFLMILPRLWQKVIAGVCSFILLITFILTLSRGAFVMLPIIAVLFVLFLPKGSRVQGTVFSLVSMIPTLIASIKINSYIANPQNNSLKIWLVIFAGAAGAAVITVGINYIVKWLEQLNWKVYTAIIASLAVIVVVGLVVALNVKTPLELAHSATQSDSEIKVMKSASLTPGKEYKLKYSVEASMPEDKPNAYWINVTSRSDKDILQEAYPSVIVETGKETNGIENREITFKVPEDSRVIDIFFSNMYQGTRAVFHQGEIVEAGTESLVKELTLNYKYLPLSVMSRFEDITTAKSNIERRIFYQDGLKSVKDHWLIGAGGGAWKLLYFKYQSYLYWTTESHNYFLQILVECGIIGLIVLLLFLAALLIAFLSEYRRKWTQDLDERVLQTGLFISIVALLMHSAIDFDFSLAAVFMLLWVLAGLYNSRYRNNKTDEIAEYKNGMINRLLAGTDIMGKIRLIKVPQLAPGVGGLLLLLLSSLLLTGLNAEAKYNDALEKGDYDTAYQNISSAADTDLFNPGYRVKFATLMIQKKDLTNTDITRADKLVARAEALSGHDVQNTGNIGGYYIATGKATNDADRIEKGLGFVEKTISMRPLNPGDWQQLAAAYHDVAMYYFGKQDPEKALVYADKALKLIEDAKEVNKRNVIPFTFTATAQEILERLQYVNDNIKKGGNIDISKLAFYSLPAMDVDSNGVPDQWTSALQLKNENGVLLAEGQGQIQSRMLRLKAEKSYRIDVELNSPQDISGIPFSISNVNGAVGELKPNGNIYSGEFTLPADFAANNNVLVLSVNGKLEMKSILVTER